MAVRREQFGPNKLREEEPTPAWLRFLTHFHDVLLGAALVTALLGEWIDTGVIVGLLHKIAQHHEWAKQQFDRGSPPLYTCEAGLSEAFHLLDPVPELILCSHKLHYSLGVHQKIITNKLPIRD